MAVRRRFAGGTRSLTFYTGISPVEVEFIPPPALLNCVNHLAQCDLESWRNKLTFSAFSSFAQNFIMHRCSCTCKKNDTLLKSPELRDSRAANTRSKKDVSFPENRAMPPIEVHLLRVIQKVKSFWTVLV